MKGVAHNDNPTDCSQQLCSSTELYCCFELYLQCAMLLKSFGLIHLLETSSAVVQRAAEEKPISRAALGRLFLTSWLLDNKDWRSLFVQQKASVFVSIRINTQDLECVCWPASAGSWFCLYLTGIKWGSSGQEMLFYSPGSGFITLFCSVVLLTISQQPALEKMSLQ